jgi:RNA polymerase sigma-70 factor, ECF subfamily
MNKLRNLHRGNAVCPEPTATNADATLLYRAQSYLAQRKLGQSPAQELQDAWALFYDAYSRKIRDYAFTCGAREQEVADCVQEVWAELLVRLPTFRLDPARGKFDTWLFQVVRSRSIDLHRRCKHRFLPVAPDERHAVIDGRPSPVQLLEQTELLAVAWDQLRKKLSNVNLEILRLRLVEQRPVPEVAAKLGLSSEQVWYRFHRARQELQEIGSAVASGRANSPLRPSREELGKAKESAQGIDACSVSRGIRPGWERQGGNCVDYVFQRLELGRRELRPEWKVEWDCDAAPRPVLYIRKIAIVAYAEFCGSADFIQAHWPRIANAALAAGVAAGLATIIATPTAALPVFQTEFHKHFQGKSGSATEDLTCVALSARHEPHGPWCECKG